MATKIRWRLKKPVLECLRNHGTWMSAEEISQALGVEIHKISMCLLRLKRQDLVEAPESAKRKRDLAPRPGHRDRARQFYNINPTKGMKRLLWYAEQERLLKEPKPEVQPEPTQEVQTKRVRAKKPEEAKTTLERFVKE